MSVEVRACAAADLSALRDRWPTTGRVHDSHYEAHVRGDASYLVAWVGDEPVGSVMVQWGGYRGERGRESCPDAVEVNHLQVRAGWRGRGVGGRLVEAAELAVGERGLSHVCLGVADDNPAAERLYRRLGYRPTGVFDVSAYDWVDDDGSLRHAVERDQLLVKVLRPARGG